MLLISVLALLACTPDADRAQETPRSGIERIQEGSPEAFGILAFLNDAGTTESLLDDAVALDRRAARSLIAHRDGPDRVFGTADDDLFETIAEVDAQYYVGNTALVALLKYVERTGWIPDNDELVGSWDGVGFTADEVRWTLELANTASPSELDVEVGLDSRAAHGIVDARPIPDMYALADAYYVGASALTALRDYAVQQNADPGAGIGESCDTTADCAEGLKCMGELAYGSGIFCVDTWDVFTWDEVVQIPDDGTRLTTSVNVQGLASVPVDVVLTVDIDHDRPSDLVLSIDNFNGYGETLWVNEAEPSLQMVVRAFPSDDAVNGTYSLHLEDTVPGAQGVLRGWELSIVSTWD